METWLLEHGEDAVVVVFFSSLLVFLILERFIARRRPEASMRRRWIANATLTTLSILAMPLTPMSFLAASLWAETHDIGLLNSEFVTGAWWLVIPLTLVLRGFISFFTHWLNHKVPLLWRLHRVHHMDTELDVSSTVRFHPLEMPLTATLGLPLVIGFGLNPWVLVIYELLDASVTLFSHSNVRIPAAVDRWLRYIIVTPDLHRVHHSSWQPETDSNFSAVFPIWDIVLGTFRTQTRAPQETMELGLEGYRGDESASIGWLLASPFIADHTLRSQGEPTT